MPVGADLAAIIMAAGYSSRVADFKPLLPLDHSNVIETAMNTFLHANINDITFVRSRRGDDLTTQIIP
ncbi:MAG: NTP transferase domain-containing protein [Dissulfurispiraceae bacterium]